MWCAQMVGTQFEHPLGVQPHSTFRHWCGLAQAWVKQHGQQQPSVCSVQLRPVPTAASRRDPAAVAAEPGDVAFALLPIEQQRTLSLRSDLASMDRRVADAARRCRHQWRREPRQRACGRWSAVCRAGRPPPLLLLLPPPPCRSDRPREVRECLTVGIERRLAGRLLLDGWEHARARAARGAQY
eukprot:COSAG06_NODE_11310_length_1530_cov_2.847659_2_plen_184_part_00